MKKNILESLRMLLLCLALLALFLLLEVLNNMWFRNLPPPPPPAPAKLTYIPQFVLISFDGSRSIDIWKMIRDLKGELKNEGKNANVTHFINAAYFLTQENRSLYQGPHQERGFTNIGVSEDLDRVRERINEVNMAVADGDEIAVHTVGHFSGLYWSTEDWLNELNAFNSILFGFDSIYQNDIVPKLQLKQADIVGFRAPYLDHDQNLYVALHSLAPQYRYDSSEVGNNISWPIKDGQGLWHIPLGAMIRNGRPVLAMDYNWYVQDSEAKDAYTKGTPGWQNVYDKTLQGLRNYFNENYHGTRTPVLVGYHFETWNDGVYWEVLRTFAKETCGRPEVICGTFKELVDYLDEYGTPKLTAAQKETASAIEARPRPSLPPEEAHNE